MYKKAILNKLRFPTDKGNQTVEQIAALDKDEIAVLIRQTKSLLKKEDDDELGFLKTGGSTNSVNQQRFDILKDLYLTKIQEEVDREAALNAKSEKQKALAELSRRKEASYINMTDEQLLALIK